MSELATDQKTAGDEEVKSPANESADSNGSWDHATVRTADEPSETVDDARSIGGTPSDEARGDEQAAAESEPAAAESTPAAEDEQPPATPTTAETPVPLAAGAADAGSAVAGAAATTRLKQVTERLVGAFLNQRPIEGKVIGWNKGGFHVSLEGVAGFCPRSLMELGNPRKPAAYLDQTFKFLITNVDEESRRIVVSRKEILEQERKARRDEVRKKLEVGAVLRGRVESLVDFGAFVDLDGGVKGLVHLSEISRKRIDHPKDALRNGQEVDVKIIKIEKGGDRISLSMRALEPDPWESIEQAYQPGSAFTGKVARHSEFGLFVEVAEGIEGLVHTSQLPLGVDLAHASIAAGQTITGWVREVDTSRHRLSLTMREVATGDPWRNLQERYQEGQAIKGKVEHASKFGFFIELEPGITGLLPFSEVSTPPGRRKENMYHPGQEVTVQVLQVDAKRRRISLGSEGSKVEGSTSDYRAYLKRQQRDSGGLNALAAAFEKLKQP